MLKSIISSCNLIFYYARLLFLYIEVYRIKKFVNKQTKNLKNKIE